MRRAVHVAAAGAVCMAGLLLAGCGTAAPDLPSSANLTPSASPTTSTAASTATPVTGTWTGTVSGKGLTCVVFDSARGSFALTGHVPAAVERVAHARVGTGQALDTVTIRVTGHTAPDLLSTCSLPVLVADKVVVLPPTSATAAAR